ncbi:hypothetical protein PHJA_000669100 [Phtheirospermum japonicum]|uniref:F-box domain-containing protein n=1 Tax=Phtheirospermum japonicum TaxID=374723 RepID=A0A830BKP9_9LAMI|nr:hypothetical protein PHJA_000669100 [Phtheirospermum japonicum]
MATEGTSSFNHLPNDTVRAILSWLPVKSLLKLRSVSKSWNTIISDRMHLQRQHHVRLDKTEFRIWKKEKGGDRNTWNERMVIENEKPLSMSFRPVCLLENNKILFQFVEWGRFLACSPCEKTFEKFADINHDPLSQDKLFLCRESMMLNVENLRRPKRKLSEPLELKTFIFPTEVSFT